MEGARPEYLMLAPDQGKFNFGLPFVVLESFPPERLTATESCVYAKLCEAHWELAPLGDPYIGHYALQKQNPGGG